MRKQIGFTLIEVLIALLFVFGACGWVWNIVKLIQAVADPITALFILRIVGIFFAPLGAILGFF